MTKQGRRKIKRSNFKLRERHAFWWIPEFVNVEVFKGQKYAKTGEVFKILENHS